MANGYILLDGNKILEADYNAPVTWTSFHIPIPEGSKLTGFIMVEQLKSVDFRSRRAKRIESSDDELLSEVLSILDACIY